MKDIGREGTVVLKLNTNLLYFELVFFKMGELLYMSDCGYIF